jgi:hypothetical protein
VPYLNFTFKTRARRTAARNALSEDASNMDVDQHAEQAAGSIAASATSQNLGSTVQDDAGDSTGNTTVSSAIPTLPAAEPTASSSSANQPTSAPSTSGAPVIANSTGSNGAMDVQVPGGPALALRQTQPDLDLDPFADNSGLTAEELAEISMDPDAEDEEVDDADA